MARHNGCGVAHAAAAFAAATEAARAAWHTNEAIAAVVSEAENAAMCVALGDAS